MKFCSEFPRLENTSFSDDAGDQLGRGHVERGIEDCVSGWCDRMAAVNGGNFYWVPLFDGNVCSCVGLQQSTVCLGKCDRASR